MPRQTEQIGFAEIEDADIGEIFAIDVQAIVMGQPGQGLAPPGGIPKPGQQWGREPGSPARFRVRAARCPTAYRRKEPGKQAAGHPNDHRYGEDRPWDRGLGMGPQQVRDLGSGSKSARRRISANATTDGAAIRIVLTSPSIQEARSRREKRAGSRWPITSQVNNGKRTINAAIFSRKARPTRIPTTARQSRPSGRSSPFQKANAAAAQISMPGMSVPIRWASA